MERLDLEAGTRNTLNFIELKQEKPNGSKLSFGKIIKGMMLVGLGGLGWLTSGQQNSSILSGQHPDRKVSDPNLHNIAPDQRRYNGVVDAEDESKVYSGSESTISNPEDLYSEDWYMEPYQDQESDYYTSNPESAKTAQNAKTSSIPRKPITVVLGASHQDEYATFMSTAAKTNYMNSLTNCVSENPKRSLWACQAMLMREGIPYEDGQKIHHPVASIDLTDKYPSNLWHKDPYLSKQRFALIVSGKEETENDLYSFAGARKQQKKLLTQDFKLPQDHIVTIEDATSDKLDRGMQAIQNKIQEANLNPSEVQLMIFYTGHGDAVHPADDNRTLEGLAPGASKGRLGFVDGLYSEDQFWEAYNKHLAGTQTVVVLDTCQAGAWTDPPPAELSKGASPA
jgi:hypothetical protein